MQKYRVFGLVLSLLGCVGQVNAMHDGGVGAAVTVSAFAHATNSRINAIDDDGDTQLHKAVKRGDVEGARQLLGLGADPNVLDAQKNTVLHYACASDVSKDPAVRVKHRALVQSLYLAGADTWLGKVKRAGPFRFSHIKAWLEFDENIRAILEAGVADRIAQLNSRAFCELSGVQNHPMKARLVKLYELEDAYRLSQYLLAGCRDNNEGKVIRALYLGADVNSVGKTALHLVAEAKGDAGVETKWDGERIARLLLDCRASVNARAHDGTTALHVAVKLKKHELVWLLLTAGADMMIRDNSGKTPLALAGS